jgi:hypothetical protein
LKFVERGERIESIALHEKLPMSAMERNPHLGRVGIGCDQRKRGITVELHSPADRQAMGRGKSDPHSGKAAGAAID